MRRGGGHRGGGGRARGFARPYPVFYGNPYIYPTTLVDTEALDKGSSQMVSYRNHNIELKGNGIIIYNSNGTQVMMKSPGTVEEGKKMIDDMLKKTSKYDGYMTTGTVGEFKVSYMPRSAGGKILDYVMVDNIEQAKAKAKELRANNNSVLIMKNVKNDKGVYEWEILPLEDYNNDKVNKWIIISLCVIIVVLCIKILRNTKV